MECQLYPNYKIPISSLLDPNAEDCNILFESTPVALFVGYSNRSSSSSTSDNNPPSQSGLAAPGSSGVAIERSRSMCFKSRLSPYDRPSSRPCDITDILADISCLETLCLFCPSNNPVVSLPPEPLQPISAVTCQGRMRSSKFATS